MRCGDANPALETPTRTETNGFSRGTSMENFTKLVTQTTDLPLSNKVNITIGPVVLSAGLGTACMTTTTHGVGITVATLPSGIQTNIEAPEKA